MQNYVYKTMHHSSGKRPHKVESPLKVVSTNMHAKAKREFRCIKFISYGTSKLWNFYDLGRIFA